MEGSKRYMRVTKMKGCSCTRDWLPYEIKDTGLSLVSA